MYEWEIRTSRREEERDVITELDQMEASLLITGHSLDR